MKLMFIRHGEPNYAIDSLTEKGWREAELLKERLLKMDMTKIYCSPLGRAKDTAKPTLEALGREADVRGWLREFDGCAAVPDPGASGCLWDRLPSVLYGHDELYDKNKWIRVPFYDSEHNREKYAGVCRGIDEVLAENGYVHDKNVFRVERANKNTLVFFCHYGVICVILSHLLNLSPVTLWQGFVALPTSVTTLATEEREEGTAIFRMSSFGDLSHLYAAGEPASFHARFCEMYKEKDVRH